jgi:hypothetical protein
MGRKNQENRSGKKKKIPFFPLFLEGGLYIRRFLGKIKTGRDADPPRSRRQFNSTFDRNASSCLKSNPPLAACACTSEFSDAETQVNRPF